MLISVSAWADEAAKPLYSITVAAETGSEAVIARLTKEMENRFNVYNQLFRFDPSLLSAPLRVRAFLDKEAYHQYLTERLGSGIIEPEAMYLHYNQIENRELVINLDNPARASMLAYQAFVQYLRAFISYPPTWMLEGFAIFFSTLSADQNGVLDYEENLNWLEPAKNLGDKLPSPNDILLADMSGQFISGYMPSGLRPSGFRTPGQPASENLLSANFAEFQIASWTLASFLLNGGSEYFRTLTESFMLLSPSAGTAVNSMAVSKRFSVWNDSDTMNRDFRDYLASRKTFREYMEDGNRAYSRGDLENAEKFLTSAMELRPSDHAPYYFMGLIFYERSNFVTAEQFYLASLERNADAALVNYALGINAAAEGRNQDAANYLNRAASLDPARYRSRVDEVMRRIPR